MKDMLVNWVAASTALTAAVVVLRRLFGGHISARLRYALWLVVLVRLLVPVQLYTAPAEASRALSGTPVAQTIQAIPNLQRPPANGDARTEKPAAPVQTIPAAGEEAPAAAAPARPIDWPALLGRAWLLGSAALGLALLWSNLRFARRLRRVRAPMPEVKCPLIVYSAAGLPSPCLFGVFRPAVYVTPEAAENPEMLRHVLAHETTHFRHGDHLWSLLRCAALAVHWWNPLVWLAVVLSRRDGELACDEGALRRLGSGERRAYGETLLALVTAKPRPGDLLCCATTMMGGKRSLRERIGRIARTPKRWLWATVLAAGLSVLVCACAFAKTEAAKPDGPLTDEELAYFNETYFNGGGFNIRNQFLFLAVEAPEDYRQISLFQLFYNGTGMPGAVSDEERRAAADAAWGGTDPGLDLTKCPASEMEEVLQTYLGISLEDASKRGLDQFTYLPEYDAYYYFHGDTNYPGNVTFTSGERKDGNVLLHYEGSGFPLLVDEDGAAHWEGYARFCVTLEPQADGGYHFLANWSDVLPAHPTAYPDWEPELVIPLDALAPYEPEPVELERRTLSDVEEILWLWSAPLGPGEPGGDGLHVEIYRAEDGSVRAAAAASETERDCFLTIPADYSVGWTPEGHGAEVFTDLFGHDGVSIYYFGQLSEGGYGTITDYYTFAEDGTPSLLLRTRGEAEIVDLDGDGVNELTASDGNVAQLFFQRNGTIYEAVIGDLIHEAWPESGYMSYGWDGRNRYMNLAVEVPISEGSYTTVTAYRSMWFDGESLRLYKDNWSYPDRLASGLEALPESVVNRAKELAEGGFEALAADGYGTDGSGNYDEENFGPGNVTWDDWRIIGLSGPWYETAGPLTVEVWNVSYETHTTTPERVMLAGGSYLGEDGWCMIGYPGCDYLYFLVEDGERTYLFSRMENDCSPGTEMFLSDLVAELTDLGLVTLPELRGEELAKIMWPTSSYFLNGLAALSDSDRDSALSALGGYLAGAGREDYYQDFLREMEPGGYRYEDLTPEGRAAWETLKNIVLQAS